MRFRPRQAPSPQTGGRWLLYFEKPAAERLPAVDASLHLCVRVDSLARERQLIAAAERAGVEINGLSSYWLPDSDTPPDQRAGLVLGFAAVPEADIQRALQALREAWKVPLAPPAD